VLLGMSGDWTQMYQSGVPWLTAIIVAIQFGFIAVGWWGWRNPGVRARIAKLTGQPDGASVRIGFGGGQQPARPAQVDPKTLTGNDKTVADAMSRVAAGWSPKPSVRIDRGQGSSVASMIWQSNDADRTVAVVVRPTGEIAVVGNVHSRRDPGAAANQGLIRNWPSVPNEDDLTMAIRLAAEQVDKWTPSPQPARS